MPTEQPVPAPAEEQRMFFAVLVPKPLQAAIEVVQRALRRANADIKWVEPANLHFTLKFLGQTPVSRTPELCAVAEQVAASKERSKVMLKGLGGFPHSHWPQVVWIGCEEGSEWLAQLGRDLDRALSEAGLAPLDKRPFTPHLTLGRARSNRRIKNLIQVLNRYQEVDVGPLVVGGFTLMKSELGREGPTYTVLKEFPLRGG